MARLAAQEGVSDLLPPFDHFANFGAMMGPVAGFQLT